MTKLKREIDARQDERGIRTALLVLWTVYVVAATALAIEGNTLWPFTILAVWPFSALVRSKWAIDRWPFLGPKNLKNDT